MSDSPTPAPLETLRHSAAHILAAVLYVISREKDPGYPSPF